MKKALLALATGLALMGTAQADTNAALGAIVIPTGANFGMSPGWPDPMLAAFSTVTDGVLLDNGHVWNQGTVFWADPGDGSDALLIALQQPSAVNRILLQADNNDMYKIQYHGADHMWHDLTVMSPANPPVNFGMGTVTMNLGAPIMADAFMITGVNGDGLYAVSEFQAINAPVPEPESWAMLGAGLGLLGLMARRRKL